MRLMTRFAQVAAAAILATGIAAGTAAPSDAAPKNPNNGGVVAFDTGWP